jgi:hypothetical protein
MNIAVTIAHLRKRREIIIADLLSKVDVADWHGVQDCASDLREIEAVLKILEPLEQSA